MIIFHDSELILAPDYNYQGITMVLIYMYVFQQWYEYFGLGKTPWLWTLSRQCALIVHLERCALSLWAVTLAASGVVSRQYELISQAM